MTRPGEPRGLGPPPSRRPPGRRPPGAQSSGRGRTARARAPPAEHRLPRRARRRAGRGRCRDPSSRRRPRTVVAGNRPTTGRKSSTRPKIPAQRCSTGTGRPTRSATKLRALPGSAGVTCSSAVNSDSSAQSRKPPASTRPSASAASSRSRAGRSAGTRRHARAGARSRSSAPGRHDQPLERAEQAARIAVGRDQDALRLDCRPASRPGCARGSRPRLGRQHREPANPARGLQRGVARMEDRAGEAPAERLVDPLRREAVLAQPRVLGRQRVALLLVGGQAQASGPPEGVAGQRLDPVERRPPSAARAAAPLRGRSPRAVTS